MNDLVLREFIPPSVAIGEASGTQSAIATQKARTWSIRHGKRGRFHILSKRGRESGS
ncbi:hypothetical protein ES288_A06G202000v1 [Gossypium darwinii]|uniref:Uncharacterized protein n=1 Tax=Gossypium darwinii TaxID=34276 RepID=A0A5D2G8L2_GOSDA|nr:hypothetical protein ES288_A06G202000v1 [Gossypium darwinii]